MLRNVRDKLIRLQAWVLVPNSHRDLVIEYRVEDRELKFREEERLSVSLNTGGQNASKSSG